MPFYIAKLSMFFFLSTALHCLHAMARQTGQTGLNQILTDVIIHKSRGEISLVEQPVTIECVL